MKKENYQKIIATILGVVSSIFLIFILEGIYRLNIKYGWLESRSHDYIPTYNNDLTSKHQNHFNKKLYDSLEATFDISEFDHSHLVTDYIFPSDVLWEPNGRISAKQKFTSSLILEKEGKKKYLYSVEQTIDQYGRRLTVGTDPSGEKQLVFFGGSFIYGDGVSDENTLPSRVCSRLKGYSCFNHGVAAGSASRSLYYVQKNIDLQGIDLNKKTYLIYNYIYGHLHRSLGANSWIRAAKEVRLEEPMYKLDQDKLVYAGSFDQGRRGWSRFLYEVVDSSELLSFYGVDYPLFISSHEIELFSRIVSQIKLEMKKKFNVKDMIVIFYPGSSLYSDRLIPTLRKLGIKVMDYSLLNIEKLSNGRSHLPFDGHPTSLSNYIFGKIIAKDLEEKLD